MSLRGRRWLSVVIVVVVIVMCAWPAAVVGPRFSRADDAPDAGTLAKELRGVSLEFYSQAERDRLASMVRDDQARRLREANRRSSEAWQSIKTQEDWKRFRATHLAALRASLGQFPQPPQKLNAAHHRPPGRRRTPDSQRRLREPPRAVGHGQPVPAGQAARVDARNPHLPQPSHAQDARRAARHGHDLGPRRLPGAGDGPARPRRAAAAPVPHGERLSRSRFASAGRTITFATTTHCSCTWSAKA